MQLATENMVVGSSLWLELPLDIFLVAVVVCVEVAASVLGGLKGVQAILSAMRAFPEDLEIVSNCVTVILSLSMIGQFISSVYGMYVWYMCGVCGTRVCGECVWCMLKNDICVHWGLKFLLDAVTIMFDQCWHVSKSIVSVCVCMCSVHTERVCHDLVVLSLITWDLNYMGPGPVVLSLITWDLNYMGPGPVVLSLITWDLVLWSCL